MGTYFVKWPANQQAAAIAYEAECDVQLRIMTGDPVDQWGYVRPDANGKWTVPLYGPPWVWGGVEVPEPPSCATLRAGAEVAETPNWPIVED